jgi:hypothetical protein
VGEEGLLRRLCEGMRAFGEQVGRQARGRVEWQLHGHAWGNGLAVPGALRVRTATVDLQVRVGSLAVEYLAG